jgi:hypothetical protein
MDADAIYEQAMAEFKQQQLDGGMSPDDYNQAFSDAIASATIDMIHKGESLFRAMRKDPVAIAKLLQEKIAPLADEDGTVDLDDMDIGGDE